MGLITRHVVARPSCIIIPLKRRLSSASSSHGVTFLDTYGWLMADREDVALRVSSKWQRQRVSAKSLTGATAFCAAHRFSERFCTQIHLSDVIPLASRLCRSNKCISRRPQSLNTNKVSSYTKPPTEVLTC